MTQLHDPRSDTQDNNLLVQYAANAAIQAALRERFPYNRHITNETHLLTFTYTMSVTAVARVQAHCVLSPDRLWLQIAISITQSARKLSMRTLYETFRKSIDGAKVPIIRLDEEDTVLYYIVPTDTV